MTDIPSNQEQNVTKLQRIEFDIWESEEFSRLELRPATISRLSSSKVITNVSWYEADCNEILLEIPFLKQLLQWQIIFNVNNLETPPDILSEDGFFETLTIGMLKNKVPYLGQWNPKDPSCLLKLLLQFIDLYQHCQIIELKENERLLRHFFEYEYLINGGVIRPCDVELAVSKNARGSTNVEFLIGLGANIEELSLTVCEPERQVAILTVNYHLSRETIVDLQLWDDLEHVIGRINIRNLKDDEPLMDYIRHIQYLIQKRIKSASQRYIFMRNLYCLVMQTLEPAILNGDSEKFSKISFLLESDNNQIICCIEIPDNYPTQLPKLQIIKQDQPQEIDLAELNQPLSPKDLFACIMNSISASLAE